MVDSLAGCFAMDAIAGAAFGIHVDSLKNPRDAFASHGADTMKRSEKLFPLYGRSTLDGRLKVEGCCFLGFFREGEGFFFFFFFLSGG